MDSIAINQRELECEEYLNIPKVWWVKETGNVLITASPWDPAMVEMKRNHEKIIIS